MKPAEVVAFARRESGLSVRSLAGAAGVATSTIQRIERGEMHPTVDILHRITEAAGLRLHIDTRADYAVSLVGLGRAFAEDAGPGRVRMAAELVGRYRAADGATRSRMIAAPPSPTGDPRWDAFLGALGEWLAVTGGDPVPEWTRDKGRFLRRGWWVTELASMRAWEYAGAPVAFKVRGVYLHRDSLVNV